LTHWLLGVVRFDQVERIKLLAARLNTTADFQAFVDELVDDRDHAESAAVMGAIPNEVARPLVSP
jgi:hypothetical protein